LSGAVKLFQSSGDLLADRRYEIARDLAARGDLAAAADLLAQTVERAPSFASAWFALGDFRASLAEREPAIAAFERVLALDPEDRHGARLRLAQLGAADAESAMGQGYVRALFDQYAPGFDKALAALAYRGPQLLRDAIGRAMAAQGRPFRFGAVVDLGCGTGLMAEALAGSFDHITGVDLSSGMLQAAGRKGLYDRLICTDMLAFLVTAAEPAELIVAADAFVYVADLAPLCRAAAGALNPQGLLAFSVETHAGEGVILGDRLRYAHGAAHVREALAAAGLELIELTPASTRTEAGAPVPGLIAVAGRPAR
jgi:predicted TPR repeat methyltransferase